MVRQLALTLALSLAGCGYENRGTGSNTVPDSPFGGSTYAGGPGGGAFTPNSGISNPPAGVEATLDPLQNQVDDMRENGTLDQDMAEQISAGLFQGITGRRPRDSDVARYATQILAGRALYELAYLMWYENQAPKHWVYRTIDRRAVDGDLSTWKWIDFFFTENPAEVAQYYRQELPHFLAYDFATAYCATPLYKCQRWQSNGEQYVHFLSPDPSCAPGWPWSGQPRSAGFICGVPLPNTKPLYHWYNPTFEASIYNTRNTAEDSILVGLGYQVLGYLGFVPVQ